MSTGPLADNVKGSMFGAMERMADEVASFAGKENLSEPDMMRFTMAAARYNTMTTLTSGLVKELTEGEKSIAQKM